MRYKNSWVVAQRRSGFLPLVLLVPGSSALGGILVYFKIEGRIFEQVVVYFEKQG